VIDENALTEKSWDELSKYLKAGQPGWSALPVMVLAGKVISSRGIRQIETHHSITVLTRPVSIATFVSLLLTQMNARHRQLFLKRLLEQQELSIKLKQQLALQLTNAETQERKRISSEIHDGFQQLVIAALMALEPLLNRGESASAAAEVESLLDKALGSSRSLCYEIYPPVLEAVGLKAAMEWIAREFQRKYRLTVQINCGEAANQIESPLRGMLFRSVRELLLNIVKHAETDTAYLDMEIKGNEGKCSVRDEGKGFNVGPLESMDGNDLGYGLFAIQQRLSALGGDLLIESQPGSGCTVTLRFPLPGN
jgi:signal transduction histidine kinase